MEYLRVGKYVSTHGLKGEIKIISDISDTSSVLKVGNIIYIGRNKEPFSIKSHRIHQKYDMITLDSLDSIEKVFSYKGEDIFVNKDDIKEELFENLLDYDVYNNGIYIGNVIEILKGVKYDFIVVGEARIIIPFIDNFVIEVDKSNKKIKTKYMI